MIGKALKLVSAAAKARPAYVVLQLTRRCNLRCSFCDFYREPTRPAEELSAERVGELSKRLGELGTCIVCVSGGEPTIRADLPAMTRLIARQHFPTLITNGWFMTAERARSLFEAGMQEISVSLDYADPNRHDSRRGIRGSWARAIAALRHLREEAPRHRARAYMNAVLLEDNFADLEPLLKLSAELRVPFRLTLYSRHRGSMSPPAPGVAEKLLDLKRRYPHFASLSGYLDGFDKALSGGIGDCRAGELFLFIDSGGDVYRCLEQRDPAVGNLFTVPAQEIGRRLREQAQGSACRDCWTSTRGSTELVLQRDRLRSGAEFIAALAPPPLDPRVSVAQPR
ncbi:MAG: radical SAM protein [Myxococcales bacterium]|nr:radical SAM protein [Myxococcales bacterium]